MGAQEHELNVVVVLAAVVGIPLVMGFLSLHRRHALLWCLFLSLTNTCCTVAHAGLTPTVDTISLGCALAIAMITLAGHAIRLALQPVSGS